jgi:hypothetical protein
LPIIQRKMKAKTEELLNKLMFDELPISENYIKKLKRNYAIMTIQFAINVLHDVGIVAGDQINELNEILKELEGMK